MPIWPFRRMGRRKRPPSQPPMASADDAVAFDGTARTADPMTVEGVTGVSTVITAGQQNLQRKLSRRGSNRRAARNRAMTKDSVMSDKQLGEKTGSDLSRMDTTGTSDADTSTHHRRRSDEMTALPVLKELGTSPHLRPINRDPESAGNPYSFHPNRHHSSPTLHHPPQSTMPHGSGSNKMQRAGSNKRSATGPPVVGRKLSKRRKDERIREEEIRALSQSGRPLDRYPSKTGSILRRDSRKEKSGLTRPFSDRPPSTISLPLAESIHSSMSGDSGNNAVAISAFHVFVPRPSIRLSSGPPAYGLQHSKWAPAPRESSPLEVHSSPPRERPSPPRGQWRSFTLPMATEEVMTASRTMDNLADNLDASALRDLMERDARRKEKRRKLQDEKLQQKLERRAERQRLREQREKELAAGSPSTERNHVPHSRPEAGLGIATEPNPFDDPTENPFEDRAPTPMDIVEEDATNTGAIESSSLLAPPVLQREQEASSGEEHNHTFLDSPTPMQPIRPEDASVRSFLDPPTPRQAARQEASSVETPIETPMEEVALAVHYSQTMDAPKVKSTPVLSPPDSPTAQTHVENSPVPPPEDKAEPMPVPMSKFSPLHPSNSVSTERKASAATSDRRISDTDPRTRRRGSGWAAFFRRGTNLARRFSGSRRSTPSEASFSNTSRESMSRQPLPAHLQPQTIREHSAPRRTKSKFREDLPETELPISPPDSRVQSPEVTTERVAAARKAYPDLGPETGRASASPAFDGHSARSISPVGPAGTTTALMSASLASIDSEASWLSGKPSKRVPRSGNRTHQNSIGSNTSYARPGDHNAGFNASYEELGIPDEEYFQRLTPRAADAAESHISHDPFTRTAGPGYPGFGGAAVLPEGEEEMEALPEGAVVHSGVERHPTVVHRSPSHVKSREGLMNDFSMGDVTPRNSYLEDATTTTSASPPSARGHGPDNVIESDSEDGHAEAGAQAEGDLTSSPKSTFRYQRARSVDLGKGHVRHLSAGSAKLLDIPPSRRNSKREQSTSPGPEQMTARMSGTKLPMDAMEVEESER